MPRLPRTISLMRCTDTPMCSARATCVTPSGDKNSCCNTSPGCVGTRLLGNMCRLLPVIVGDLDIVGVTRHPTEDHAPLIVDSNAVAALQIAVQCLQSIPGRRHQVLKITGCVQHIELPQDYRLDVSG